MFIVINDLTAAIFKSVKVIFHKVQGGRQQMVCFADSKMSVCYLHLHPLCKQQQGIIKEKGSLSKLERNLRENPVEKESSEKTAAYSKL